MLFIFGKNNQNIFLFIVWLNCLLEYVQYFEIVVAISWMGTVWQACLFSINSLHDDNQSGIKGGLSIETALLSTTRTMRLVRATQPRHLITVLDTVNHKILLCNLFWTLHHRNCAFLMGIAYKTTVSLIMKALGFFYHRLVGNMQLHLSFQLEDPMISARVFACTSDILDWIKELHLQLNLAKTKINPANLSFNHKFTLQLDSTTLSPARSAKNLGLVLKLSLADS